jgi:probable HAF family extracellular repeat protein
MKSKMSVQFFFVAMLVAAVAMPARLAGQQKPQYRLIDLGTLGGPNSFPSPAGQNSPGQGVVMLNNAGRVAGWADTTIPDPFCFGGDGLCLITHALRWDNGTLTDLGALPGVNSSAAIAINAGGWVLGESQNGLIEPVTGFPQQRAVVWKGTQLIELGTLGVNAVFPQTLNSVGQVVGNAPNTVPDPFSLFGLPTQIRAFLWQNGLMQDLGTLGGPDAVPFSINERGQVAGMSYTNATPNATTGMPTLEPFLWENGKMISLGTLGGTVGSNGAQGSIMINNRGQIIGTSNLAGDQAAHGFVWENGVMTDLGTFGGVNSFPVWINDVGEIVGEADLLGSAVSHLHHAFLWKNGVMTDLGTLGSTSHAEAVNARGQVVGRSRPGDPATILQHAFLWEEGGPMLDLNSLIPAGSNWVLIDAYNINDRGEILVDAIPLGTPPVETGQLGHLALLVPCEPDSGQNCSPVSANAQNDTALATKVALSAESRSIRYGTLAAMRARIPSVATPTD